MNLKSHIYGPVPSRRLGFSLGIDVIPYKTCSFDCVYCQLGKTTNKTVKRDEYVPKDGVLSQVKNAVASKRRIDYLTFSGSGEPTLNSGVGYLIREIKKFTKIPVVILTNGSLLFMQALQEEIKEADLVVPSLDAGTQRTFEIINRPHPSIDMEKIIKGLLDFRKVFKGKMWLEIMLVKGINDSLEEIEEMKRIVERVNPDKVQLNTVVRPPSEDFAKPLTFEDLKKIRDIFGKGCEIIAGFKGKREEAYIQDIEGEILSLIRRRPVTLSDISSALGIHQNEVIKYLQALEEKGAIKIKRYGDERYYEPL